MAMAFKPGESGNPAGRPQGSRHKATLAMEALLDGEAETITRKAIDLALAGDSTMIRLCLDRVLPARRDRPVTFALPPIATVSDAVTASAALTTAVANGDLTPSVNGRAKTGQRGGVKAGHWREDALTCKGARSGPFACQRRKVSRVTGW